MNDTEKAEQQDSEALNWKVILRLPRKTRRRRMRNVEIDVATESAARHLDLAKSATGSVAVKHHDRCATELSRANTAVRRERGDDSGSGGAP